jgi:hypothetical protein
MIEKLAEIEGTLTTILSDANVLYATVTESPLSTAEVPEEETKRRQKERIRCAEFLTRQLLKLDELELEAGTPERARRKALIQEVDRTHEKMDLIKARLK